MKIALLQMPVVISKEQNMQTACEYTRRAAANGADLVVLPEMFNCPYASDYFVEYAEPEKGECWRRISRCAGENGVGIVAGSMPERDGRGVYNTAYAFDRDGEQIGKHRKMHLFDIDIQGGQYFKESDTFLPGDRVTVFDFEGVRFGLCICFDVRFPELARLMALRGAEVLVIPAAFNMTTGPLHWELAFRQRAVDNQLFTVGAAPARDPEGAYVSYGNSIVCSPMGRVVARAAEMPCILYAELDMEEVSKARRQLPLLSARREDVYEVWER